MSAESARAFCVRMMSDEDFRKILTEVKAEQEIVDLLAKEKYSFTKTEFAGVISEFAGKKVSVEELEHLICGFYEEQMTTDPNVCKVVVSWLHNLA